MWSVLSNVWCTLERSVYCAVLGWNVLNISLKSIQSSMSFKSSVSLLNFCLDDLFIDVSGVLKSPTIIVLLLISSFMFVINFYVFECSYFGCINIYNCYIFLLDFPFYYYTVSFVSSYSLCFKVYLSDVTIAISAFFWHPFG